MIPIDEVCIISIDKSEDTWAIEGEIIYDDEISCPFEASYVSPDDEFDSITAEMDLDDFDRDELLEKVKFSMFNYED